MLFFSKFQRNVLSAPPERSPSNRLRNPRTFTSSRPTNFSYYSSRSSLQSRNASTEKASSSAVSRTTQRAASSSKVAPNRLKSPKISHLKHRFKSKHLPAYLASLSFIVALFYSVLLLESPTVVVVRSSADSQLKSNSEYQQQISEIWNKSLLNKTKLTINTNSLVSEINDQFPGLDESIIRLPFFGGGAEIILKEESPVLLLSSGSRLFYLGKDGYILSESSGAKDENPYVLLQDDTGSAAELGSRVLDNQQVSFVLAIAKGFEHKGVKLSSLRLPRGSLNQLDVQPSDQAYFIKFAMDGDAREVTGSYFAVRRQIEQGTIAPPSEYIDNRVVGKAYLK